MKNIVKSVLFVLFLGGIIHLVNLIYIPKDEQWARAPYYEDKNTLDVVFIGSSHIQWGIDPHTLWEAYGIPSINYAIPSLDLKNSYFLMRELLDYHTPKVIVMDVFQIHDKNVQVALVNRLSNVLRLSRNRFEMISSNEGLSFDQKLDYFFPLHLYHTRKLELRDFSFEYQNNERGHFVNFDRVNDDVQFEDVTETAILNEESRYYIDRIISLAKEHNVPLHFIKVPHPKAHVDTKKLWASVGYIAQQNSVPYIDYNKEQNFNSAGIVYREDIANDSPENGHLNHNGATKLTLHLGKILKGMYNLTDRRGEAQLGYLNTTMNAYKSHVEELNPFKKNMLKPGNVLMVDQFIESENKVFRLLLQGDGNLVLYKDNNPLWSTNSPTLPIEMCMMQGDGNLVLYSNENIPYWASQTAENPGAYLVLQNDGNLEIIKGDMSLWQTGTNLSAMK